MLNGSARKQLDQSIALFSLALLAIFVTEMATTELFGPLHHELPPLVYALADAVLMMVCFAPPLWITCRATMGGDAKEGGRGIAAALVLVLGGIFLIEFLVTLILFRVMPGPFSPTRDLVDSCLVTVFSAPPLWWLLFRRKFQSGAIPPSELLGIPLRLYLLLLFLIIAVELFQEMLMFRHLPTIPILYDSLLDGFLTTVIVSPLLWFLIIRPLKRDAVSEQVRATAIHDQVNDAIVTLDPQRMVVGFNPAAQRTFGYPPEAMMDRPGGALFIDGEKELARLIPGAGSDQEPPCREVIGKKSDGTPVVLEVSISRSRLESGGHLLIMRDVTDRKKAEQVLLESLSLQKATLESTADGIAAVDLTYRVRSFNQKFLQMWGIPAESVQVDGGPALLNQMLDKLEEPEEILALLEEIYHDPEQVGERELRLRDGRVFQCCCAHQRIDGQVVGQVWSFRDISARTRAEQALRESEELFRQVFDQTEDAIMFFVPGTCTLLDLNSKAESVFGYRKSELVEYGLERILKEGFQTVCAVILGVTPERPAQLDAVRAVRKDGSEILVTMRGKVMMLKGAQVIYCTFRDVTDRMRMEREAHDIQSRLIQTNKMTALGLLVSGVAHEINNPNNYIMANSRLLANAWRDALKVLRQYREENGDFLLAGVPFSELEAHTDELFEGILDGTQRIEAIINNLKSFARQDRTLDDAEVDLNRVATSAVTLLHHELARFTNRLHVELGQDLPKVKGSSQQLGQVMVNLLTNACHALPDKSRGIWFCTGYDEKANQVTITVRDEGCGITRDDGNRILEPFFTTKLDNGGTGLGLSICNSIVKDHSGSLEFSSEPGKGTTFTVRLPAKG